MAADSKIELQVAGRVGIPDNAAAAMLNVTAVLPSAGTYLTVYPCDSPRPDASNINSPPYDIRANTVFVKLSKTGTVCIYTVAATDIVVDINGYVPAAGTPTSVVPARLLETRSGYATVDGQSNAIGLALAESKTEFQVAGRAGVPLNAAGAMLNVTAILPDAGTYLTVYPCDSARPDASNINSPPNDIRANSVFVKLSATGKVCIYTVAATDIIVDINGYVPSGRTPVSQTPARLFETRAGYSTIDGQHNRVGQLIGGHSTEILIIGRAGIPRNASSVFLNLTGISPQQDTYFTVYPCTSGRPNSSNLNVLKGDIQANSAYVKLSTRGTICIYTVATTDMAIDVTGYIVNQPTGTCDLPLWGELRKIATDLAQSECTALVNLNSTSDVISYVRGSADPCDWAGVTCADGHVIELKLNAPPAGSLPNIGKFPYLYLFEYYEYNAPLPPEINQLQRLKVLRLYSPFQDLTFTAEIGKLQNLTVLDLEGNGLASLPAEIGNLKNLRYLNIEGFKGGTLPNEIGSLTNLRQLIAYKTSLTTLPPTIGNLKNLIVLDAGSSQLTSVPPEIGSLTNLKVLLLGSTHVKSPPDSIGNLHQLIALDLTGVGFTTVPPFLGNLTNLVALDLSENPARGDVTSTFMPLMLAGNLEYLDTGTSGCLYTSNRTLAVWLMWVDVQQNWLSNFCARNPGFNSTPQSFDSIPMVDSQSSDAWIAAYSRERVS